MTKVQIVKTRDGQVRSFHATGHTGYAEAGGDIVCAGVSAIVISTVNSLQDLLHEDIDVEADEVNGGDIRVTFNGAPSGGATLLVDSMIHGLEWIRRQYGSQYLSCQIKEVE